MLGNARTKPSADQASALPVMDLSYDNLTDSVNASSSSTALDPQSKPNAESWVISAQSSCSTSITNILDEPSFAVQHVLQLFRAHQAGLFSEVFIKQNLTEEQYQAVRSQLRTDPNLNNYVNHKVRYNYSPYLTELSIQMLSEPHERLSFEISKTIDYQLENVVAESAKDPQTVALAKFLETIHYTGSTDQYAVSNSSHMRQADGSFQALTARFPGIVVEIAHSRGDRDLEKVAHDWIRLSLGSVKKVVGISLAYPATNTKSQDMLYAWKPQWNDEDLPKLTTKIIVHANLASIESVDKNLVLLARDFAPLSLLQQHGIPESQFERIVVSIPFSWVLSTINKTRNICHVTHDVLELVPEREYIVSDSPTSSFTSLTSEDEAVLQAPEGKSQSRSNRDDPTWHP